MNRIDNTTNKPALRVCVPRESAWPLPMARGHQWPRCEAMVSSPAGGVESPLGPFGHSASQFLLRRSPEIKVWGISWCLLLLHGCGCCKDKASHWACRARAPLALCPQGMSPALLSLQTCPCVVLHIQRNKMSLPGHLGASNIFLIHSSFLCSVGHRCQGWLGHSPRNVPVFSLLLLLPAERL